MIITRSRVLVCALAAVIVPLAGCSDDSDDGRPAPVGTVIDSGVTSPGRYVEVQIPDGRIDFTVGEPVRDLAAYDESYDRAADGASFVAVGWDWNFASAYRAMAATGTERIEPHIWLVADGTDYSLDQATLRRNDEAPVGSPTELPLDFSGAAYVVVPGEPTDLAIKVEFDGLEQTVAVDDPGFRREGPAAALYGAPDDLAQYDVACGRVRVQPARAGDDFQDLCTIGVARVPYVAGLGWVEDEDARWLSLVTSVRPNLLPVPVRGGRVCASETEVSDVQYQLDGEDPVRAESVAAPGEVGRDRVVFASSRATGAGSELVITAVQQVINPQRGCPTTYRLTWRLEV